MASGSFFPLGFCYNKNAQYHTLGNFIGTAGPLAEDVDIDQIVSITPTSKFPQSDGTTYLPSFRIVAINQKTYKENVYYILAEGLTLANIATAISTIDSSAKFTTYPGLLSIDYNTDAILDYGSALLNDRLASDNRIYNMNAQTTDVFMYVKRHTAGPQVWTFTGDLTYSGNAIYL